jgi:hypothetical protein
MFNLIYGTSAPVPTDVSSSMSTVNTTVATSTVIGTVRGIDASDRYLRYDLDNPKFLLRYSSTTRTLTNDVMRSDFGSLSGGLEESLTVTVRNRYGRDFSKTFSVPVIGTAPTAPTSVILSNLIMDQGALTGQVLGTGSAQDPDDTSFTWALSGPQGNLFTLSSTGGATIQVLRSSTGTLVAGTSTVITLQVTDSQTNSLARSFTLVITGASTSAAIPDRDVDLTVSSQYLAVERASAGWYLNSSAPVHGLGTVVSTASNTVRYRFSGGTLRGAMSEQQSTNYMPHPDMRGQVNGNVSTIGSLPFRWQSDIASGCTLTVLNASTTTNGVFRLRAELGGTGSYIKIIPKPSTAFSRTVGQPAQISFRVMLHRGTSPTVQVGGREYDTNGTLLREDTTGATLITSTFVTCFRQGTILDPTTASADGSLIFRNMSTAVSCIVDIICPMLEPQTSITEPIMIGGYTRLRDILRITGYDNHKAIYVNFQFNASSQNNPVDVVHLSDGTDNNAIRLITSTSMALVAQVVRAGVTVARRELGPLTTANTTYTAGFTFTSTAARFALGGQPSVSTSFPSLTRVSTLKLGVGGTDVTRTFAFSRVQLFVSTQASAVFDAGVGATPEAGAPPPTGNAFYVSASTGVDTNPGTLAQPFLTWQKARDAMRAGTTKTTYVRQGRYTFTTKLDLTASDDNTRWYNYPGEKPLVSSGTRITGFASDGSTTYSAPIAFDPLLDCVVGGVRYRISRSGTNSITGTWDPTEDLQDTGWYFADVGTSSTNNLKFRSTDLTAGMFVAGSHPYVHIETCHHYRYQSSISRITGIDFGTKVVSFSPPARDSLQNGSTYRLLGRPEWISRIREFGYAPERGKIILRPHNESTFEADGVYVPRLDTLVDISGSNIEIVGITFAETRSRNNLVITGEDAKGAVIVRGVNNRIGGCYFKNVGEAITLSGSNHEIGGNRLAYLGGGGIIGNRNTAASSVAVYANLIHDVGIAGGIGAFSDGINMRNYAKSWNIAHNHIQDTARAAIGGSGSDIGGYFNNVIEYNKCLRVNLATGDTGHIQNFAGDLGPTGTGTPRNYSQNTDCRYNWCEDAGGVINKTLTDGRYVWEYGFAFGGVYLDGMASGWRVHGNLFLHTVSPNYGGIMVHGGNSNICTNNFTVFYRGDKCSKHGFYTGWYSQPSKGIQTNTTDTYTRNISYSFSPQCSTIETHVLRNVNTFPHCKPDPGGVTCNTNLVFRMALMSGQDSGSVVADPLFVNASASNFRLDPSSPAFALGIQDLPWPLMGLINDTGGNAHLLDTANLSVYPDFWTGITALTQLKAIPTGRCEPVLSQNLPDE